MNTLKKFKKKELLPHIFITDLYLDALMDLKKSEQKVLVWIIKIFQRQEMTAESNIEMRTIAAECYIEELIYHLEKQTGISRRLVKSALKNLEKKKLVLIEKLPYNFILFALNLELIVIEEETGRP
jgi:hypothetical protein